MAILKTGTFSPAQPSNKDQLCRDDNYRLGSKTVYYRDCRFRKEDPATIVKWMRRNFGERHHGWDFSLVGGCVTIELWDAKFVTMYEMWYM